MFKKFKTGWRNFWGNRYRIYQDGKLVNEILIYHKKIFIKERG